MNHWLKFFTVVLVFGGCVFKTFANGFTLADQDAFAAARGDTFVATADNASAIYYNPAGIAQLSGNNLRGGIYGIDMDPAYTRAGSGATYHISDPVDAVPQAFFTHTFTDSPWSVGLGVYAPFGGSMDWPHDIGFRAVDPYQGSLTYLTINPVVALKLAPNLFLGAGLEANYVDMEVQQGISPISQGNFFQFEGDGWSAGYNLGALWQPIKQVSFGATFRSATPVTLRGHTDVEDQPLISSQETFPAHMTLTFPLSAVVGVSYRPTPKWNVEFDANYTAWSSFSSSTLYQEGSSAYFSSHGLHQNIAQNFGWQDSWIYEFGLTRYFGKIWHVSAGYAYDENSVPNAYYSPLAADMDRHFFSIGAGFNGKLLNLDLTYQFGYGPGQTVTGSGPTSAPGTTSLGNANGKYSFISNAVMLSAGIHF